MNRLPVSFLGRSRQLYLSRRSTALANASSAPAGQPRLLDADLHRSCNRFNTVLSRAAGEIDEPPPPNLVFDTRSSFAPEQKPNLALPRVAEEMSEDADVLTRPGQNLRERTEEEEDDDDISIENVDTPRHVIALPDRLKANVHDARDGSVNGTLWLNPTVFGIDPIRVDLIKQSVDFIRNKIRGKRKAKSKTIGEVSGSGRKVRQQKGTGKARAGHSRPAHWRGGAKAHGPKNTVDYGNVKMNKKAKRLAMASMLSQKLKEGNLIVVDNLMLDSYKTSAWAAVLENRFGIGKSGASALIVDNYHDSMEENAREASHASHNGVPINLWVASSNISKVMVVNQSFANVYNIMKREKLIVTLSALSNMEEKLKL